VSSVAHPAGEHRRKDTGSRVPFFCFLFLGKQEKEVAAARKAASASKRATASQQQPKKSRTQAQKSNLGL